MTVVAVVSPKGGVGKTTCAFLLGATLCLRRGCRVLAVGGGGLGLRPTAAARPARAPRGTIASAEELRPYLARTRAGLDILPGGSVEPGVLRELYDVVILDGPVPAEADRYVVVTTPDWLTAARVLEASAALPHERVVGVVNRAREPGALAERLRALGVASTVALPDDPAAGGRSLRALALETRAALDALAGAVVRPP